LFEELTRLASRSLALALRPRCLGAKSFSQLWSISAAVMLQCYSIIPRSGGASNRKQDPTMITLNIGPFPFWVISPFAGAQLWTYYCVLSASSNLKSIAVAGGQA
jgi:hypothetical protein